MKVVRYIRFWITVKSVARKCGVTNAEIRSLFNTLYNLEKVTVKDLTEGGFV